jgi:endo-1,4-beta-xylanase
MRRALLSFVALMASHHLTGCGTSNVPPAGAGGAGAGGTVGGGGASSGVGGASVTGGAAASGGTASTGGSGGAPSGGGSGSGGEVAGSGGTDTPSGGSGSGGSEPCVVDHMGEVPSLKDYYADHFAIGAAIDTGYNGYSALLTKHFNSITAEDQMKFDALQPSEGNFSYGTADGMVNYAIQNGMQVRGHALVWHRQTPSWVFSGSSTQVLNRMKNHITNVMQHFAGKVKIWDVVNEAIMDDGSYRTQNEEGDQASGWYGALQESYIAEAFIAARAADPDAKLFYNDYYNYHPVRRQAIYDMLSELLDAGVPVDGVGLQGHLNLAPGTNPDEQSYHQTVANMEEAIEMYSSLGLEVQVTELDISLYLRGVTYTADDYYTPATFTQELKDQQAARYHEFYDMFRAHSDVITSVTTWGIADDNTWLSEFDSGRQDFPLLFDIDHEPKPAFWAVVDFCK